MQYDYYSGKGFKMKLPVAPRHVVEQRLVFVAVNRSDLTDRFQIEAPNENAAKAVLIYKLGYIIEKDKTGTFWLVDDENKDHRVELESETLEEAYTEVLKAAHWDILEPDELLGEQDDDNEE